MTDYTIKRYNPYTKQELISALNEYVAQKKIKYVAAEGFCKWFGISEATLARHFGKWSNLCKEVGLNPRYIRTDDKNLLLENLGMVWEKLGRQPRAKEMKQPLSPISDSRYLKVFGNWHQTCLEFLSWKSGMSVTNILKETKEVKFENADNHSHKRRTNRGVSLALRYEVLRRDKFRCVRCGRSPATNVGVVLHIDHKKSWDKQGETTLENLQTLCLECNLGKSNKE